MISMRFSALLLLIGTAAFAADPSTGKVLAFSDDFNGDKIDETKWGFTGSRELFSIVKIGKFSVARIGLKMGTDMIQVNSLSTRGKFSQQYGYFEASMRMNAHEGHAGTLRIISDDEKTPPALTAAFHSQGKDLIIPWGRGLTEAGMQDFRPDRNAPLKTSDAAKRFHTYGVLWTEKSYSWLIDGRVVHKLDRKEYVRPMHVVLSHRILEEDRPKLMLKTLPDDVDIDWVKVWK
jgi:hypothetical protein